MFGRSWGPRGEAMYKVIQMTTSDKKVYWAIVKMTSGKVVDKFYNEKIAWEKCAQMNRVLHGSL